MAAFDPRHHAIHSANGELSARAPATSAADVRRIVGEAVAAAGPAGIVLNFHGGLVSLADALDTAADRLFPLYSGAGAYPVFFVWESGFLEAPFDNLEEICGEPLFREFVKKSGEWAARVTEGAIDSGEKTRIQIEAWFATGRSRRRLPAGLRAFKPAPRAMRAAGASDREALAKKIEASIARDAKFQAAMRAAQEGLHPQRRTTRMDGSPRVTSTSLIDKEAAARLFPLAAAPRKGASVSAWLHASRVVADIVLRVWRRVRTGRDHGKYVTVVEEVLRELYVDRIGRVGWWDRMKGDTADAFKAGERYAGTVFLRALHDAVHEGPMPRITLVGHSTGAVFIGHFLEAAARWVPDLMFDLVLEAPAATHDFLAKVVERHGSRIRGLRLFGMSDARERDDVLVPVIYPASLLYFVSGLLEDEPDQPITGMARFQGDVATFDPDRFPNVDACRRFFARYRNALVWSPRASPAGCASDARHHQDFDDRDAATLASVAHILRYDFHTREDLPC